MILVFFYHWVIGHFQIGKWILKWKMKVLLYVCTHYTSKISIWSLLLLRLSFLRLKESEWAKIEKTGSLESLSLRQVKWDKNCTSDRFEGKYNKSITQFSREITSNKDECHETCFCCCCCFSFRAEEDAENWRNLSSLFIGEEQSDSQIPVCFGRRCILRGCFRIFIAQKEGFNIISPSTN